MRLYGFALVLSEWFLRTAEPLRHATRGPPQLCIKQLYAILRMATPAKPFRGGFPAPLKGEAFGG